MSGISHYQAELESLASQLEKLLKVINHSDPSAENMKHVLYKKYKLKLSHLACEIKQRVSWVVFSQYLVSFLAESTVTIDDDSKKIVTNKLIKDFESEFIVRHELPEFNPPDPVDVRQQQRIKRIRRQIRNNRKKTAVSYKADDIGDMFQHKFQQKAAKTSLEKLVKAFSKIEVPETKN